MTDDSKLKKDIGEPSDDHKAAGKGSDRAPFSDIGLFEVLNGDIVLRGRHGERDHLYPMHRAVVTCQRMEHQLLAMARNGMPGWDTLMDVVSEFEAKLSEACEERYSLGRPVPQELKDLVEKIKSGHHDVHDVRYL